MYRSWVMDTLACPRRSAPIRADSPASSMSVATVLRKLCEVTSGIPTWSRTARHAVLKFSGSRSVPLLDAKITCCWPTYGRLRPSQCTWQRRVQIGRDGPAVVDGDQVDVLAEPAVREMRARKGGAADEVDSVTDVLAEKCQQIRDEMVALDLFGCDAKLLCDFGAFVSVHSVLRPMIQPGAAKP
jgi:hypothetical protein